LFADSDWVNFFMRITGGGSEGIITKENEDALSNNRPVIDFLRFILVSDPNRRPDIEAVCNRFKRMYAEAVAPGGGLGARKPADSQDSPVPQTLDPRQGFYLTAPQGPCPFTVFSDVDLILVRKHAAYSPACKFVIDFRKVSDLSDSPLLRVVKISQLGLKDFATILTFSRECAFNRGRLGVVDDAESPEGLGFMALVFLARELLTLGTYQAFSFVVTSTLLQVSSNALVGLRAIDSLGAFSPPGADIRCPCGDFSFLGVSCPEFRSVEQLPALAACSCASGGFCPNKGHCAAYLKWLAAELGEAPERLEWLVVGDKLRPGKLCKEVLTVTGGLKSQRYRCRVCRVLTHALLTNASTGEFVATAVLRQGGLRAEKENTCEPDRLHSINVV